MSLTKASYSMINGAVINVLDYGAVGDGVANDTAAIQAALDAAQGTQQVFIPAGTYKVTNTLNLYKGSNVIGINKSQGEWEYAAGYVGSKIVFAPSSEKDLFTVQNLPLPTQGWRGHVSVGGLFIEGDSNGTPGFARRAFDLNLVIYGNFYDMEIKYFWSGFLCTNTINNKFSNVRVVDCTTSCVEYAGTAPPTTDVWTQCTFQLSPIGVRLATGVGIRFVNCLLESLDYYGMVVQKPCSYIQVVNGYGENVPSANDASRSMFQVGAAGGTASFDTMLQIIGGSFAGRNAGTVGSFLDVDYCNGVQLVGTYAARYTNIIKTTTNTANGAVACSSVQWIQSGTLTNNLAKISGAIDYQAVNAGTGAIGVYTSLNTDQLQSISGIMNVVNAVRFEPLTDNATSLGYAGQRWSVVYAATGTINTSDRNDKTDERPFDYKEKAAALAIKARLKTFKFKDAVEKKGNDSRIHFGVIAQDVKEAFEAEGLDSNKYGVFCSDTWKDDDGKEHTRLGVRYDELFAFILGVI